MWRVASRFVPQTLEQAKAKIAASQALKKKAAGSNSAVQDNKVCGWRQAVRGQR